MPLELTIRSRRRAARARRWVIRVASLLLTLIAVSYLAPAAVGLSIHNVTDDAMGGSLAAGSAVITDAVPVAELEIGDVITYTVVGSSGTLSLVTRRIAEIDDGFLRTRSDRSGELDPWTVGLDDSSQELAVGSVPYAGYVVDAFDGSVRLWVAVVLAVLLSAAVLTGLVARRRDRLSSTDPEPSSALGATYGGEDVRVPTPRRAGTTRRRSIV